jgi:hypothetical protein
MNWQVIGSLSNLALVLFILFYQIFKNRALVIRIEQQKAIIEETKAIVSHQSTAIESQGKVVDTAVKYSEAFAPEKLEKIIRRELEIEKKEDIEILKAEFSQIVESKESEIKKVETLYEKARETVNMLNAKMVSPLLKIIVNMLIFKKKDERMQYLSKMEDGDAKKLIEGILGNLDQALAKLPEMAKDIMNKNPNIKIADALREAAKELNSK